MKLKHVLIPLALTAGALSLCSCAPSGPRSVAQMGYVAFDQNGVGAVGKINAIRRQALEQTATSLGAQGALAWRSKHINNTLNKESQYLNEVFDFNAVLIGSHVLPPVLVQNDGSVNLSNDDSLRISNKTYKIVSPARFVTVAPTWRMYLWMSYSKPVQPNTTLLPKNEAEIQVWNEYLKRGWEQGLKQADQIFMANLAKLKQIYLGMLLYRKLLSEHMVSAPFIATANLGVTGNSKEINIDDRLLRITSHSALQTNPSKWMPVVTK